MIIIITAHDTLVLLRASFSAPKLQHIMSASPCCGNKHLLKFDELLRTAISKICNFSLSDDQWLQASLLVKSGSQGIRRVSSLASPALLASAVGTRNLQNQILYTDMIVLDSALDICQTLWQARYSQLHALASPAKQQIRDKPIVERELEEFTERQINNCDKAKLLASTPKHNGDWLTAIPISSCGLRLDDEAVRIAVDFRLGVNIYEPHSCEFGELVDVRGSHALSYKRNSERIIRHNYNDIIHLSFNRAGIPATKEPQGLSRSDSKRPDGLTLTPCREGRCLVWDITVADTTTISYLPTTAELAATHKVVKYEDLSQRYCRKLP